MPYNIKIQNEQGEPLAGVLYFWLNGEQIGEAGISVGGSTLSDEEVEQADHYTVESPGYYFLGISSLYNDTVFTLTQKPRSALVVVLAAAAAGFVLSKIIKFKL